MIKSVSILFLLVCCGFVLQAQDEIRVQMVVPSEVFAGQEFMVNVNIEKGALEEFSRFQQELPAGLIAVQENSGTADFSFDNQRVRFIWLKLPAEPTVNISYKVRVHERLKGSFTLFGEFSYVEENERRSIVIDKKEVNINPSPSVAAEQQVDVGDFAAVMARQQEAVASTIDVTCIRQTPYPSRTGNDILVHLLVYKKDMDKFAKIEETIPEGFEAVSMEARNGLFTFKDGVAKFVWMNLPEVPGFKISYRLIPEAGKSIRDLAITGVLSYIMEGRNVTVDVVQQDIDLANVSEENIEPFIIALERGESPASSYTARETEAARETVTEKPAEEKPVVTETRPADTRTGPAETRTSPSVSAGSSRIPSGQLLPVYDGTYFRVQIAATRHFRDANQAFAQYRLSRPVLVEQDGGLYKYTVGSFTTYTQARSFKENMAARGLRGAFVVSYRNGKRIDIIDALQATGGR